MKSRENVENAHFVANAPKLLIHKMIKRADSVYRNKISMPLSNFTLQKKKHLSKLTSKEISSK